MNTQSNHDRPNLTRHTIDPARLSSGEWSHERNRTIGEGDIAASYSADMIAFHGRVRRPFRFQNGLWVCVGKRSSPVAKAKGYRLVDIARFDGDPTTYAIKTRDGEAARSDPNGFYHGMTVSRGKRTSVLVGPPVEFIAGEQEQMDLFGV